jgi:hypothetical protein
MLIKSNVPIKAPDGLVDKLINIFKLVSDLLCSKSDMIFIESLCRDLAEQLILVMVSKDNVVFKVNIEHIKATLEARIVTRQIRMSVSVPEFINIIVALIELIVVTRDVERGLFEN